MSFNYSGLQGTATRLIGRFGQPAQLSSSGEGDTSDYANIEVGESAPVDCTVVLEQYSISARASGLIADGDVKVLISLLTEPPATDRTLTIAGMKYNIIRVEPVRPGGVDILYMVQARGIG